MVPTEPPPSCGHAAILLKYSILSYHHVVAVADALIIFLAINLNCVILSGIDWGMKFFNCDTDHYYSMFNQVLLIHSRLVFPFKPKHSTKLPWAKNISKGFLNRKNKLGEASDI